MTLTESSTDRPVEGSESAGLPRASLFPPFRNRRCGAVLLALLVVGLLSQPLGWAQAVEEETAAVTGETEVTEFAALQAEEAPAAEAEEEAMTPEQVQRNLDFVWTLVAAFLVFIMQGGFALVEAGFTRSKNAINICMKNLMDFSVGSLAYMFIGFSLMFGATSSGWIGSFGFAFSDYAVDGDTWLFAFWMFQVVFCATAATIVSGAMAERTKFVAYLFASAFITAVVYPIFGSWAWGSLYKGGGWLEAMGFIDFAGSTVVHSVGGWAGLAGALVLGPRIGKYAANGKPNAIRGHNITLATLGVFLLWFGWFGFNPGSTTAGIEDIALIAVNTNVAAAAGAIMAMIVAWVMLGKPDASMTLNGALAGLVGITAGCANVTPLGATGIGLIAGILVVVAVLTIDRAGIDDPVGAVSVHGVCGAWGTLGAGLFNAGGTSMAIITTQLIGIVACFVWTFGTMFIFFKVVDMIFGLRVTEDEERKGLDIGEHGMEAYAGFETLLTD